jgi:hypothetical protein
MVAPAAMAVMVPAGMDADGQGFGSAGAQQGPSETCGNQFFHGGSSKEIRITANNAASLNPVPFWGNL